MSSELLERYIKGTCTQQERQLMENWLKLEEHADELDELMAERWQHSHDRMPEEETRLMWEALQRRVQASRKVVKMHWYRAIAAAAVVVVVVSAGIRWHQYSNMHNKNLALQTDTLHLPGQQWMRVSNANNNPRRITLDDGSVVELPGHSAIEYAKGFEKGRRTVVLTGTATFTVANDKLRPFSVYSSAMVTTALGTRFTVTDGQGGGLVRLYEGKVAVRAINAPEAQQAVILMPGQECSFNNPHRQPQITAFAINTPPAVKGAAVTQNPDRQDTLVFGNAPLVQVLKQLQQYYHTTLQYQPKELAAITFSGTISRADSLPMVLQIIAHMNGLHITNTAHGYSIGK